MGEIKGAGPIVTAGFRVVGQAGQSGVLAIKNGEACGKPLAQLVTSGVEQREEANSGRTSAGAAP